MTPGYFAATSRMPSLRSLVLGSSSTSSTFTRVPFLPILPMTNSAAFMAASLTSVITAKLAGVGSKVEAPKFTTRPPRFTISS